MTGPGNVRYAHADDGAAIAWTRFGRGPALVHTPNVHLSHVVEEWRLPGFRRWLEGLARGLELIRFDHRGGGLSAPGPQGAADSLDALVDDLDAVVRAAGLERFALFGMITGSFAAIEYAARHPDRVSHLVLWNGFAREQAHSAAPRMQALFAMVETDWELFTESLCQAAMGWADAEEGRRWAALLRKSTSPETFASFLRARREWNVEARLGELRVPTRVLHDPRNALASEERSRELAAAIPGAQFCSIGSDAGMPDAEAVADLIAFVHDAPVVAGPPAGLTAREREVLALLATGAGNPEIASRLSISIHTVTRHLTRVYAKLGVRTRAEAVGVALRFGIDAADD